MGASYYDWVVFDMEEKKRVCVIGLGNVGLPTALRCAEVGHVVYGYDIDNAVVVKANNEGKFICTTNWNEIPEIEIFLICVGTGMKDDSPNMDNVFDACNKIAKRSHKPDLVVIESTLDPGTTRIIWNHIFRYGINVAHVPHRFWASDPEERGVVMARVAGAVAVFARFDASKFYRSLGVELFWMVLESAELTKIAENAKRYVEIAFVEELRMICEVLGIDFEEVWAGINTHFAHQLLEARDGIGGECLPLAVDILTSKPFHATLIHGAKVADRKYRMWLARSSSHKNCN